MASIYIHIPFCHKACTYCDFHFSVNRKQQQHVVDCIVKEIELRKSYLNTSTLDSIYFGGGTPSLLSIAQLAAIFNQIHSFFEIAPQAEITLEANPDDISAEKLQAWHELGINRLSVGIQSFAEDALKWMNRSHSLEQAFAALDAIQKSDISAFSIDLMYGLPTSSQENEWEQTIATALSYHPDHISAYCLTVEPKTALANAIQKKAFPTLNEDQALNDFNLLRQQLKAAGYLHYELSNFCLPNKKAKHNSAYWQGEPYLGIGPSAHSFDGKNRQWNVASNTRYVQALQTNKPYFEVEELSMKERYNEFVMTGLRTIDGFSLEKLKKLFGEEALAHFYREVESHHHQGRICIEKDAVFLHEDALFQADAIISDLFWV